MSVRFKPHTTGQARKRKMIIIIHPNDPSEAPIFEHWPLRCNTIKQKHGTQPQLLGSQGPFNSHSIAPLDCLHDDSFGWFFPFFSRDPEATFWVFYCVFSSGCVCKDLLGTSSDFSWLGNTLRCIHSISCDYLSTISIILASTWFYFRSTGHSESEEGSASFYKVFEV